MNFCISVTFALILSVCFQFPVCKSNREAFSASSQKLFKANEHQKDKNFLLLKKVQISSASAHNKDNDQEIEALAADKAEKNPGTPVIVVSGASEDHGYEEQSCINPQPPPLQNHAHFAEQLLTHRFFVPIASTFFYNRVSMFLTGELFDRNDPAKACIRMILSKHHRHYFGFGKTASIPCEGGALETTCTFTLTEQAIQVRVTAVWSDGAKVVLMVACSGGRGGWAVASNERTLDPQTERIIRAKIGEYVFDTTDVGKISYNDCGISIPNDVQEGTCDDEVVTVPESSRNQVLHVLEQGVYAPFSSLANVYYLGMVLRGVPLEGNGIEKGLCATQHWSLHESVTTRGFGNKKAILECDSTDITNIQCIPSEIGDNRIDHHLYLKNIRPIWTDGSKYVLAYNCLSTHSKTWILLSIDPTADVDTMSFVLKKIAFYGFDPKKASINSYSTCPATSLNIPTDETQ